MIPMEMRHEEVKDALMPGGAAAEGADTELTHARSHVADDERAVAGLDLDTGGGAAIGRARCEIEFGVDECRGVALVGELSPISGDQRARDLGPDGARGLRNRNRSPRSPNFTRIDVSPPSRPSRRQGCVDRIGYPEQLIVSADRKNFADNVIRRGEQDLDRGAIGLALGQRQRAQAA